MYTAIQSAIAVDFTLYKIKLLLLLFVGSKTSYLIQRIGADSLAPARVTSSVCLCVQGSRLAVFVR